MNLRPTVLLCLAGVLAFAAALRFRTAVQPEELSDPEPYAAFAAAAEQVPALLAVRVHTREPDAALRIRRTPRSGEFLRIHEFAEMQLQMQRGRLAHLSVEALEQVRSELRSGAIPRRLPAAPDARPYFRDSMGAYPCDVMVRDPRGLAILEQAVPEANLRGDPVARYENEDRRAEVLRATIAALVALLIAGVFARSARVSVEHRLLAVLAPLVVLGWSGLGVDLWTLPALVLVAMAPVGAPLLAGAAGLAFPALALQRLGWVFLCGGILRLWPRPDSARTHPRGRDWAFAAIVAIAGWFGLQAIPASSFVSSDASREPAVMLVDAGTRVEAANQLHQEGFRQIVGGKEIPEIHAADRDKQRLLSVIHRTAKSMERTATGDDLVALGSLREAAARDGIMIPASFRQRRTAVDGRDVLWIHDPVEPDDARFASHARYRAQSESSLRTQSRWAGALVFALAVLLRVLDRRALRIRDLAIALIGFVVGASWLFAGDAAGWGGLADPLLPTLAIACFASTWGYVLVLAAAAVVLPGTLAIHLGAFLLAACLRALARDPDEALEAAGPDESISRLPR